MTIRANFAASGELLTQQGLGVLANPGSFAVDTQGNIYVAGRFQNQAPPGLTADGTSRFYIAKYTPEGTHIWSRELDASGTGQSRSPKVLIAPSGKVAVQSSYSSGRSFFAVLEQDGTLLWETVFPDTLAFEFAVRDDFIATIGFLTKDGTKQIGPFQLTQGAEQGAFLATLDMETGMVANAVRLGNGTELVFAQGVIPRGEGWLLSLQVAGQPKLATFSANGTLLSTSAAPDSGTIAETPNGELILTALYDRPVTWGDTPELQLPDPENSRDGFLIGRLQADGTPLWLRGVAGSPADGPNVSVQELVISPSGNLFLTGFFRSNEVDLGGGLLPLAGRNDVWVASYSGDGDHRWSRTFGSTLDDVGLSIGFTTFTGSNGLLLMGAAKALLVTELGQLPDPASNPDGTTTFSTGTPFIFGMTR